MVNSTEASQLARLEDFIELAKQSKPVSANVELRKQMVMEKVHPEQTADMSSEIETYLAIGDFAFSVEGKDHLVSKVYMYTTVESSVDHARENRNVANARLRVDYDRLKAANIYTEEKYF